MASGGFRSFVPERNGGLGSHEAIFCEEHPGVELETYCREHDLVLCSKCVVEQHRTCIGLEYLRNAFTQKPKKEELKRFDKEVLDMKQKLLKQKKKHEGDMKRLKEETDKAEKDIEDFRKLIDWVLDRMERKGKEYIQKRYTALNKIIADELSRCEDLIARLDNFKDQRKATIDGLPVEQCVKISKGRQIIAKSRKVYEKMKNTNNREIVKFTVDPKVENFARSLSWYGKDKTYLSFEPPLSFPHLYQVKAQNQFDIRMQGDKHVCSVVDMCQIDDGTILVADASNCRLKQLDVLYRLVDSLALSGEPRAVCSVDKEDVVVAIHHGTVSVVQFINLENGMQVKNSFSISKTCQGLEYMGGMLYMSSDGLIHVYTITGEEMNCIDVGKTVKHFSISQNCDNIFMITTSGLTVTNKDGDIAREFVDESVKDVNSIALDTNSQMLVSNGSTHSIVQYNHDLQTLGSVICPSSGFKNPQALVYDRLHCRLVVGMQFKNVIRVFDLK